MPPCCGRPAPIACHAHSDHASLDRASLGNLTLRGARPDLCDPQLRTAVRSVGQTRSRFQDHPPFGPYSDHYQFETLAEALAEGVLTMNATMPEFRLDPDQVVNLLSYPRGTQMRQRPRGPRVTLPIEIPKGTARLERLRRPGDHVFREPAERLVERGGAANGSTLSSFSLSSVSGTIRPPLPFLSTILADGAISQQPEVASTAIRKRGTSIRATGSRSAQRRAILSGACARSGFSKLLDQPRRIPISEARRPTSLSGNPGDIPVAGWNEETLRLQHGHGGGLRDRPFAP